MYPIEKKTGILLSYGIEWGKQKIVRDIFQNYYDSVLENKTLNFHNDINVDVTETFCSISGPIEFNWDYLHLIGATTKSTGTFAGGFGEGFKMMAICLFKHFPNVIIKQYISAEVGELVLKDYGEIDKNHLTLVINKNKNPINGSKLVIENADTEFLKIFEMGKTLFLYPENELFKEQIFKDKIIEIYELKNMVSEPVLFYKYQNRFLDFEDDKQFYCPLAFSFNQDITIIAKDRDRTKFNITAAKHIISHVLYHLTHIKDHSKFIPIKRILECIYLANKENTQKLVSISKKSSLLKSILEYVRFDYIDGNPNPNIPISFRKRYLKPNEYGNYIIETYIDFSETSFKNILENDLSESERYKRDDLIRSSYILINRPLINGFESARDKYKEINGNKDIVRKPTLIESTKFELIEKYLEEITDFEIPKIKKLEISINRVIYNGSARLGSYSFGNVILNTDLMKDFQNFSETAIHEITHYIGPDYGSKFSDVLTRIIGAILSHHEEYEPYRNGWHLLDKNESEAKAGIANIIKSLQNR